MSFHALYLSFAKLNLTLYSSTFHQWVVYHQLRCYIRRLLSICWYGLRLVNFDAFESIFEQLKVGSPRSLYAHVWSVSLHKWVSQGQSIKFVESISHKYLSLLFSIVIFGSFAFFSGRRLCRHLLLSDEKKIVLFCWTDRVNDKLAGSFGRKQRFDSLFKLFELKWSD